jgi:hypothetical protein
MPPSNHLCGMGMERMRLVDVGTYRPFGEEVL